MERDLHAPTARIGFQDEWRSDREIRAEERFVPALAARVPAEHDPHGLVAQGGVPQRA